LILFALLAIPALAGPKVEFRNTTINFGRISQNRILTADIWVKSVGDETLKIELLWSGCGCTEIPLNDSTIAPGDSISLRVIFNTGRFSGLVTKKPEIRTNASEDLVKFSILADVILEPDDTWPVVLRPDGLDVSQYGEKTRRMGSFHLENRSDEDLRVSVVDSALKAFEVKVPDMIKAGETIEGRIRVRDDRLESDFDESVTFRFQGKETNYYTLPIRRRFRPIE
jgi:hypothetical protein